jgi:hypothetical protein
MSLTDHPFICGIEVEGLYQTVHYPALEQAFSEQNIRLSENNADLGDNHFTFSYDGSIFALGRHRNLRGLSDFEFKTYPFAVSANRFPIPNQIMRGFKLLKSNLKPILNHTAGLHVHLSGVGMSIAEDRGKFLHNLQNLFWDYTVPSHRTSFCKCRDRDSRYSPVRRVSKWHYEFRIFNATLNERAIQTAVFNCISAVIITKRKMRKEREEKDNKNIDKAGKSATIEL